MIPWARGNIALALLELEGMNQAQSASLTLLVDAAAAVDVAAWASASGLRCRAESTDPCADAYLETFDGRLYEAGFSLSIAHANKQRRLEWRRLDGQLLGFTPLRKASKWASDLPAAWDAARSAIAMRALNQTLRWHGDITRFRILDKRDKTVAALTVRQGELETAGPTSLEAPTVVTLEPLKGFESAAEDVRQAIFDALGAPMVSVSLVPELHAHAGVDVAGVSSKFAARLAPETPAGNALASLLQLMRETLSVNEAGLRADIDSEFLHDFRVAVRRSRSLIARMKSLIDPDALEHLRAGLSWLGGATGPVRDLDVYLLNIPRYQHLLGIQDQTSLEPLRVHLMRAQRRAHRTLVRELDRERYGEFLDWWDDLLERTLAMTQLDLAAMSPPAALPIREVASTALAKQWKRVRKGGRAIKANTRAEALHELRIECKKLRYLLEAFRSLYDDAAMAKLVKSLKRLQDNLGDFQDLEIQQERVRQFAEEMQAGRNPPPLSTFLAMGRLIEQLRLGQQQARERFAQTWRVFDSPANSRFARAAFVEEASH